MNLQHAVKYHKARDWIYLQNQNTLAYPSLLMHCKQLEQFQKAKAHGRAKLITLSAASVNSSFTTHRQSPPKAPNAPTVTVAILTPM